MLAGASNTLGYGSTMNSLTAGSAINNYSVQRVLGRGGMGVVYGVKNSLSGTDLALKMMDPAFVVGELPKRFDREVNVLTEFNHPNIVNVTDHGFFHGIPYMVMEKLRGRDLSEQIAARQNPAMSLQESLPILLQVMDALEYAHNMGVVHRDLKPANIFVCDSEPLCVKLLDFGIAKLLEESSIQDTLYTQDGMGMGTADYMSWEQAWHKNSLIDGRTDIWALGAIMFVLLTGQKPFPGENMNAVLHQIMGAEQPPRLDAVMDNAPIGVQGVINRTLHPDRDARFASVNELRAALKTIPVNGRVSSHSRTAVTVQQGGLNTFVTNEITPTATTITMSAKRRGHVGRWLFLTTLLAAGGVGGAYYLGEPNVTKLVNRAIREGKKLLNGEGPKEKSSPKPRVEPRRRAPMRPKSKNRTRKQHRKWRHSKRRTNRHPTHLASRRR